MNVATIKVDAFTITDVKGLDPVTVFLRDIEPGKGQIIIECYCDAWAAYWGAMGKETVAEFVASATIDYVVNRLQSDKHKQAKGYRDYLTRIVDTVRMALRDRLAVTGAPNAP